VRGGAGVGPGNTGKNRAKLGEMRKTREIRRKL